MAFSVTNDFSSGTNTSFSSELNENNTDIENEFNGVTPTPDTLTHITPIGSVVSWLKNYTNTPSLPDGWVECDGSTLSDSDSVYNGQVIPDLNGDERFLKGSSTSGTEGGTTNHRHQWHESAAGVGWDTHSVDGQTWNSAGNLVSEADRHNTDFYTNTASSDPRPPFYSVVWIMRVK